MTTDDIATLRAALAACPAQESEWLVEQSTAYELTQQGRSMVNRWSASVQSAEQLHELSRPQKFALARYIAAASPDRIARLLDALESAQKDAARYRALRAQFEPRGRYSVNLPAIHADMMCRMTFNCPAALDAAVDAAMQGAANE